MKLFRRLVAVMALMLAPLFCAAPAAAEDTAVEGTWQTTMATPMGNFSARMTIAQSVEGYSVELVEQMPEGMPPMASTISNVVVAGNSVTFDRSLETPQGAMALAYSFTADGDSITGEAGSDFGPMAITGTRVESE